MHYVKCSVCGIKFDRDTKPCIQTSSNRWAHEKCVQKKEPEIVTDELSYNAILSYAQTILKESFSKNRIEKQIKTFIQENGYTYNGILNALKYWYEVKENSPDKAYGGIGIVPYIYTDACNYYKNISEIKERHSQINFDIEPQEEIVITISPPKLKPKYSNRFSILDKER